MLLWSIQNIHAYEKFMKAGTLTANENHLCFDGELLFAYDWMAEKMQQHGLKGLKPPPGVKYPIWAWYTWEGKRKRRDMRESGYAERGTKIVQLTIEVDNSDILLSDFDLYHHVLNYWYLPLSEADDNEFEKNYKRLGLKWGDWQNSDIQTTEMDFIRSKIKDSWDRVFDLEREDDGYLYGLNSGKSIQATFWCLRREQVLKAENFIAR